MPDRGHFGDRLADRVVHLESVLCVGLDPRRPFPDECVRGLRDDRSGMARAVERYCLGVLDGVAEVAAAVKPQVAFFEALGGVGLTALEHVCTAARERGLIVIADAKRGDIPSTATAYACAWLGSRASGEEPLADAMTVQPYLGEDSLAPYVEHCDAGGAGLYVLVRTSNAGADDLQTLELAGGERVWQRVGRIVSQLGEPRRGRSGLSSIGAVVGLTHAGAIGVARRSMPWAPLLIPGFGAQGGSLAEAAPAFRPHPGGGLLNASRSVIEAWRGEPGAWRDAVRIAAEQHRTLFWQAVDAAA
jgi:orotidine-5'-phosphate decarboxylase